LESPAQKNSQSESRHHVTSRDFVTIRDSVPEAVWIRAIWSVIPKLVGNTSVAI